MRLDALIERNPLINPAALFRGTSVPIAILFEFLQDDQTLETFLDQFPTITREHVLAVLNKSRDTLLEASLDTTSDESQVSHLESTTPNLVCRSCRDPIFAMSGGYLHTYTGSAECIAPLTKDTRATPFDDNQTYPAFRAELIAEMTRCFHSYCDVDSTEELLEMLLADARHFADANRLNFDDHYRRSYQLYLENTTDTRR